MATAVTKEKRVIGRDTEVEIFNLFSGMMGLQDNNGNDIVFTGYGDSEWVTVRDLQTIKNKQSLLLECGALGVKDKEVLSHLRISDLANGMIFEDEFNKLISAKTATVIEKKLASMNSLQLSNFAKVARDNKLMIDNVAIRVAIVRLCNQPRLFG